ncbi:MAG: ABC transporter ATP-binding protein, partial [Actinomycetota bacterium]
WLQALVDPVTAFAVQGSFLVVLAVGGARVVTGAMATGDLVAFLLYLLFLALPLVQVFQFSLDLQAGLVALDRMGELLDVDAEPVETPTGATAAAAAGVRPAGAAGDPPAQGPPATPAPLSSPTKGAAVELVDVVAAYEDTGGPALEGVSLRVEAGHHLALVGPSGAGKTTVLSLLCRFVEPAAGTVALDGRPVSDWPLDELRAAIGYVEQDSPVLGGTLRENLVYAAPGADDAAIAAVLERVRLAGLVGALPRGLDTDVGEAGVRLSGGERQRLAIARSLLAGPRLLLLDEATSQLDALSEAALREVVSEIVAAGTTVLTVAHRLSTVSAADALVVLESGRVEASGRPDHVEATSPLYRRLLAEQRPAVGP